MCQTPVRAYLPCLRHTGRPKAANRCYPSAKLLWYSRMDLTDSNSDGIWERNVNALSTENDIRLGYLGLGTAP